MLTESLILLGAFIGATSAFYVATESLSLLNKRRRWVQVLAVMVALAFMFLPNFALHHVILFINGGN